MTEDFDYVLVGGGLANGLIALGLLAKRPAPRVALIEQGSSVGGNHTWSFHESDLGEAERELVTPLVRRSWPSYDVFFPSRQRRISRGYAACDGGRLHSAVSEAFARTAACELLLESRVVELRDDAVVLGDGRVLHARVVLDGRGAAPSELAAAHRGGYQKFLGLELELEAASPAVLPVLMDARVEQTDGYRFVYVLPFSERRVLIEDTYYSLSPELDRERVRDRILEFARAHGYRIRDVEREEHGVLPIPTHASAPPKAGGIAVGMRAGWFHPTTGYSLPFAARFATRCASCSPNELAEVARAFSREHEARAGFARLLNRLLFRAFAPADRRHVLERFYGLPEDVIARFYALTPSVIDRARVVVGWPPRGFSIGQLLLGDRTV